MTTYDVDEWNKFLTNVHAAVGDTVFSASQIIDLFGDTLSPDVLPLVVLAKWQALQSLSNPKAPSATRETAVRSLGMWIHKRVGINGAFVIKSARDGAHGRLYRISPKTP